MQDFMKIIENRDSFSNCEGKPCACNGFSSAEGDVEVNGVTVNAISCKTGFLGLGKGAINCRQAQDIWKARQAQEADLQKNSAYKNFSMDSAIKAQTQKLTVSNTELTNNIGKAVTNYQASQPPPAYVATISAEEQAKKAELAKTWGSSLLGTAMNFAPTFFQRNETETANTNAKNEALAKAEAEQKAEADAKAKAEADKILGMPKTTFFIIVGVLVIGIIAAVVLTKKDDGNISI